MAERRKWTIFTRTMKNNLLILLNKQFGTQFEYDVWDHENGYYDIQLWLPYFCGTVVFMQSNRDNQIAYISTVLNKESDITSATQKLLETEAARLNTKGGYKFKVNGKLLYLEHEVVLSKDKKTAAKELFDAIMEINHWAEEWYKNKLLKMIES